MNCIFKCTKQLVVEKSESHAIIMWEPPKLDIRNKEILSTCNIVILT